VNKIEEVWIVTSTVFSGPYKMSKSLKVKGRDFLYCDAYLEEQRRFTSLADYSYR
jgi:hypothetical protein